MSITSPPKKRKQGVHLAARTREELQVAFLTEFRDCGIVRTACDRVGIHRTTPYTWRQDYPAFAEQYDDALQDANDVIRAEIFRRGVEGWLEPVYQGGKKVGTIRRYDMGALKLMASSRMPEFRDRMDVTSDGHSLGSHEVIATLSADPEITDLLSAALNRLTSISSDASGTGVASE